MVKYSVTKVKGPPVRAKDRGQTMTEYALILAAIAIVAIVAYTTLGGSITALVNEVIACM
ncbi:MAG TPA: Flp family type IVb pilin [Candidatus Binataceae bacterium]|nr:Flp family type IVb pilin [Candidatus Binataceae bacterium]